MRGDTLSLWCFSGPTLWALTDDETGGVLPPDLGPWVRRKAVAMADDDPEDAQALRLVREHGYCCFDPDPPDAQESTA